ncbi:hypothetical protein CEUSTIGMA_g8977.t1 [Chlamydomonas eustigma]|uniref:Uncharacterized protein n=1 Tax=Chlamydomonas eustigma TaxID=1157962 RepID=A0A250XF59_9CHLO|nr:hypothetical protein CEUSTIGMA_g8977.t1 [Chlamydomonas eustigma]|eukprot:GAX81549.1 hypothetical protein CEUSTIGMA_g8977.t1 [Chlamydomonas eustigma]
MTVKDPYMLHDLCLLYLVSTTISLICSFHLPPSTFHQGRPVIQAASFGHAEMCRVLIFRNSTVLLEEALNEALVAACRKHYLEVAEILIQGGAKANALKSSAFATAMSANAIDVVKLLIRAGADVAAALDGEAVRQLLMDRCFAALETMEFTCASLGIGITPSSWGLEGLPSFCSPLVSEERLRLLEMRASLAKLSFDGPTVTPNHRTSS